MTRLLNGLIDKLVARLYSSLEIDVDLDDDVEVPDPLKVLPVVEPWHGKASSGV